MRFEFSAYELQALIPCHVPVGSLAAALGRKFNQKKGLNGLYETK